MWSAWNAAQRQSIPRHMTQRAKRCAHERHPRGGIPKSRAAIGWHRTRGCLSPRPNRMRRRQLPPFATSLPASSTRHDLIHGWISPSAAGANATPRRTMSCCNETPNACTEISCPFTVQDYLFRRKPCCHPATNRSQNANHRLRKSPL